MFSFYCQFSMFSFYCQFSVFSVLSVIRTLASLFLFQCRYVSSCKFPSRILSTSPRHFDGNHENCTFRVLFSHVVRYFNFSTHTRSLSHYYDAISGEYIYFFAGTLVIFLRSLTLQCRGRFEALKVIVSVLNTFCIFFFLLLRFFAISQRTIYSRSRDCVVP